MKGLSKRIFTIIAAGTMVFTYCAVLPSENIDLSDSTICASAANKKTNISKCKITLSSTTRVYKTGKNMNNPVVTIKDGSKKLKQGTDYKLKYTNVSDVGTGKVTIKGYGKYSGQTYRTFKIIPMNTPKAPYVSSTENTVTLCWDEVYGASKYELQRYNNSKKKYEKIYSGKVCKYTDKKREANTSYKYRLCVYRVINGKTYYKYSDPIVKKTTLSSKAQTNEALKFEKEVIRLVNIERRKAKLPELKYNAELTTLAVTRTEQVCQKLNGDKKFKEDVNYHIFKGENTKDMLDKLNYNWFAYRKDYYSKGENIAVGYTKPQDVVKAWMNSQKHRDNILNKTYNRIGIGYKVIDGRAYWVQEFTS